MNAMAPIHAVPTVYAKGGTVFASSRDVAAFFGKRHDHVLRDIKALIENAPTTAPNFGASSYADSTGRTLPAYEMTRDGFTLLAMGFTGKTALGFKVRYIEEFNRMEAALKQPQLPDFSNPAAAARAWADEFEGRKLAEQAVQYLSVENERMSDELNLITVDEYRALRHAYWSHGQKISLGKTASSFAKARGIELVKQQRTLRRGDRDIETEVNVYPRDLLEDAAEALGL